MCFDLRFDFFVKKRSTLKNIFLADSKKKMMLTWREGLLVVVFKKPLAFFSEKKYELSSRLSHRFTGRTSLDCGKKEIQRERE